MTSVQIAVLAILARGTEAKSIDYIRKTLNGMGWSATSPVALLKLVRKFEAKGLILSESFDENRKICKLARKGFEQLREYSQFYGSLFGAEYAEFLKDAKPRDFRDVKPKKIVHLTQRLPTHDEMRQILDHASAALGRLIRFSIKSLTPVTYLIDAQIEKIDWERCVLTLPEISRKHQKMEKKEVRLNEELKQLLVEAVGTRKTGVIFRSPQGKKWGIDSLGKTFRRVCSKLDLSTDVVIAGNGGWTAIRELKEKYGDNPFEE